MEKRYAFSVLAMFTELGPLSGIMKLNMKVFAEEGKRAKSSNHVH
jgi:hypothetical protein